MTFLSRIFARKACLDFDGFVDWHSHILPGVDDGIDNIDDSLQVLEQYEQAGINEVWLTPHIMEDVPNTTDCLRNRFDELCLRYQGPLALHLASENMMDNLFLERLERGDLLPIGKDKKSLLVETSYFNAPIGLTDIFEAIHAKGYFPLFAHPERYNYLQTIAQYKELKKKGVRFQLNLMSLAGHYGPDVKDKAEKLLAEGLYDAAGSDLHRLEHVRLMENIKLNNDLMLSLRKIANSFPGIN